MPKFNVLMLSSLTHVIANLLNLKHICCAVMAEWLTHLTKDVGYPVRVSLDPNFPPLMLMFVWVFLMPATVKGLKTKE